MSEIYRVEEHGVSGSMWESGWRWSTVTERDTFEGAVSAATAYASHMDAAGIRPYGMRVCPPRGASCGTT